MDINHYPNEEHLKHVKLGTPQINKIKNKQPEFCWELSGVDFHSANFHEADFSHSILDNSKLTNCWFTRGKLNNTSLKHCKLDHSRLNYADISNSQLDGTSLRNCKLNHANLSKSSLNYTDFDKSELYKADFSKSNLKGARLTNIQLGEDSCFEDTLFYDAIISIHPSVKEDNAVKVLSKGVVNNAQFMDPLLGRKVRDQSYLNHWFRKIDSMKKPSNRLYRFLEDSIKSPWLLFLIYIPIYLIWDLPKFMFMKTLQYFWGISSNYGRDFGLWVTWCTIIVAMFAFKFWTLGSNHFTFEEGAFINATSDYTTYLYYSISNFTLIGYGDIAPVSKTALNWVIIESIVGYMMLGGLISILFNELARKNN